MSNKVATIIKIIAIVIAVAAAITVIVIYRKQISETLEKLVKKVRSLCQPREYEDFADV